MEGEKPSKLFCALEKHNGVQRYVPQLLVEKNNQEILITEQKSVENEIFLFYKNLFSNKDLAQSETVESFLDTSCFNIPKLSETQK